MFSDGIEKVSVVPADMAPVGPTDFVPPESVGNIADGDGVARHRDDLRIGDRATSPAELGNCVFEPMPVPLSHMPTVMP